MWYLALPTSAPGPMKSRFFHNVGVEKTHPMAREWPWEERKELEKKNWDPTATSLGNEVADFPSACSEPL